MNNSSDFRSRQSVIISTGRRLRHRRSRWWKAGYLRGRRQIRAATAAARITAAAILLLDVAATAITSTMLAATAGRSPPRPF